MKAGLVVLLIGLGVNVYAQFPGHQNSMIPVELEYDAVLRAGNALTINYDQSDELIFAPDYNRVMFPIHSGYDTLPRQNLVYASYALDSIVSNDNAYWTPFNSITGLVLDSVGIELGHVNNSAAYDTILLTLVTLDAFNFPGGPDISTDTIVTNVSLSVGNILTNTTTLMWYPNYSMNNLPVGIRIAFHGSLQDTLALISGYGMYPSPNSCTDSSWDKARRSNFYSNSYAYYSDYNLILPTSVGGDIFYDCNGNIIQDSADSESYIQNWAISAYVSAPEIGIQEEGITSLTIYPNPAGNIVYLNGVDTPVQVGIYNLRGQLIKSGIFNNNIDITNLNSGIYIFAFKYENRTIHKKVVVQH